MAAAAASSAASAVAAFPETRSHERRSRGGTKSFTRDTDLELLVGRAELEPMDEGVEDVGAEGSDVGVVGARPLVLRVSVHRTRTLYGEIHPETPRGWSPSTSSRLTLVREERKRARRATRSTREAIAAARTPPCAKGLTVKSRLRYPDTRHLERSSAPPPADYAAACERRRRRHRAMPTTRLAFARCCVRIYRRGLAALQLRANSPPFSSFHVRSKTGRRAGPPPSRRTAEI